MTYAIAGLIIFFILAGAAAILSLFANLLRLAGTEPGQLREIDVNGYATPDEGWKLAQRQDCPPGSICVPSRDNLVTGMYMHADYRANHPAELQAQYERDADTRATPDGINHGAEGSTQEDSRRVLSAEDAALLLGMGEQYRASLAAGDDYVDTTWREAGDRKELHW